MWGLSVRAAVATIDGISDQTPLEQTGQQLKAAAVALEMSWLRVFSEVGCLTDDLQAQAATAVRDPTCRTARDLRPRRSRAVVLLLPRLDSNQQPSG